MAALEHDYRYGGSRLVRQRSHIVLLAYRLKTQMEIAEVVCCSDATVSRTLAVYRRGGRQALRRDYQPALHPAKVSLGWQRVLAEAMKRGPQACGVPRPTWTAPLLADYLAKRTGIVVSERTVRRGLDLLGYVCRRPTWTVRHKAEEQEDYAPKRQGSK
jgi:transposase